MVSGRLFTRAKWSICLDKIYCDNFHEVFRTEIGLNLEIFSWFGIERRFLINLGLFETINI